MKYKILLISLFIALLLSSCSSSYMTSSLPPSSITEVTIIDPASVIFYISKGERNNTSYNDTLSEKASNLLAEVLEKELATRFKTNVLEFDDSTDELVDHQVEQMVDMIHKQKSIEIEIPPSLDSIMLEQDINYAVCSFHTGFSRARGNYVSQVFVGALLGYSPLKAVSDLTICIIDRQRHNISFHNQTISQSLDPLDPATLEYQIDLIFSKYR